MTPDRATVACLECGAKVTMATEACPTCDRPFVNMSALAELALTIAHRPSCTNKHVAAVRTPDGSIRCHRLDFR